MKLKPNHTTNMTNQIFTYNKTFDELTTHELYEILKARSAVFVMEQNCHYLDMDDVDFDATHVVVMDGNTIVAYSRVYKGDHADAWHIGRVLSTQRNKHYGMKVMQEAIKVAGTLGAKLIEIDAQCYAIGFYEKLGFEVCSDEYLIDGILHKRMQLKP